MFSTKKTKTYEGPKQSSDSKSAPTNKKNSTTQFKIAKSLGSPSKLLMNADRNIAIPETQVAKSFSKFEYTLIRSLLNFQEVCVNPLLSSAGFYHFCRVMASNRTVKTLDLSLFLSSRRVRQNKDLQYEMTQCIARDILRANETLKKIILEGCRVSNDSAKTLAADLAVTTVEFIDMNFCEFESSQGIDLILEAASKNPRIASLSLFGAIPADINPDILKEYIVKLEGVLIIDSISREFSKHPHLAEPLVDPAYFEMEEQKPVLRRSPSDVERENVLKDLKTQWDKQEKWRLSRPKRSELSSQKLDSGRTAEDSEQAQVIKHASLRV